MPRVLLADSDQAVRDTLVRALSGTCEILYAATGAKALELAKRTRPGFAILECLLRDVSGLELLRKLKAVIPALPVVMIAPYDSDWIRNSVLQAGALDYLTKPLDLPTLRRLLDAALLAPRTAAEKQDPRRMSPLDQILVSRAVEFIDRHYAERLSLEAVARHVGLNRFALCRSFKAVRGVSFREYLLHVRLARARELLSARRYSITEIAQMVGFGDLPRFDKVFKRATGVSPSAHRGFAWAAFLRRQPSAQGG